MRHAAILGLIWAVVMPGAAQSFDLPRGATLAFERTSPAGRYTFPLGPFSEDHVPSAALDGQITRRAWQIPQIDVAALRLVQDIRDQLVADGLEVLFECRAVACGGFDFRYGIEVLDAPAMFVDLGDFYFASLMDPKGETRVSVLASQGGTTGYLQVIEVGASSTAVSVPLTPTGSQVPAGLLASDMDLAEKLSQTGATILDDLEFATGADALKDEQFSSLVQLATYLAQQAEARVVLVGHTDATGSLEANIALSKRRAEAVRVRLIERHGVRPEQISADGVGFLAPRTGNSDEIGRNINRRVEVVLISGP